MTAASLVDTNILVYRFDRRFPEKQRLANELLRQGIIDDSIRIAHQAIVEFIAATTRPIEKGPSLLTRKDAYLEAEELLTQFKILFPNDAIVRTAIRGVATYQLSWFDAHMWAYAEFYGLRELLTENLSDGQLLGTVRVRNPFER